MIKMMVGWSSLAVLFLVLAPDLAAQTDLASQRLGRGFWHVFAAYAVVWALVLGWIVHIGRRLARVEEKLDS